jgi:phosphatidylserine/phosphatidylglycerophosphate/cardiolipin synthase-like enzyme
MTNGTSGGQTVIPTGGSFLTFLHGPDVALEVLQAIGYRTVLRTATIVSFTMQDYDFRGHGLLSALLLRQLSLGASIKLITTPPPGSPTNAAFQAKYKLLNELQKKGVEVFLNQNLHAKAYLFLDSSNVATTIVGSANLTVRAFGSHIAPQDDLVEMSVLSGDPTVLQNANEFVEKRIYNDRRTEEFAVWYTRNQVEITKAGL